MTPQALSKIVVLGALGALVSGAAHGLDVSSLPYRDRHTLHRGPDLDDRGVVLELADAPAGEGFRLSQDAPSTGTVIRHPLVTGAAQPFASPWARLTETQQASLRRHYADLSASDEPPYPVGGLAAVYRPLSDLVNGTGNLALGSMSLGVVVGADGRVDGVNAYAQQDPAVAPLVAHLLQDVRFKPGLCDGQPCRMEFPVAFTVAGWR